MAIAEFESTEVLGKIGQRGSRTSEVSLGFGEMVPVEELVLPEGIVLGVGEQTWFVKDRNGDVLGLGSDSEGALMVAYGITRGRTIDHAWRAFQNLPEEGEE